MYVLIYATKVTLVLDFLQFQLFYDFTRHVVKVDWRR